jgi:hypothetical protein
MTYAIVGYAFAGLLWIVWLLSVRSRTARLRRSSPGVDR